MSLSTRWNLIECDSPYYSSSFFAKARRGFLSRDVILEEDKEFASSLIEKMKENSKFVVVADSFYKRYLDRFSKDPEVKKIHKQIYAKKVGVPVEVFDEKKNKGLYEFLVSNFMHKKFEKFPGGITYTVDHKAEILFKGRKMFWEELSRKISSDEIIVSTNETLGNTYYTYQGFTKVKNLKKIDLDKRDIATEDLRKYAIKFEEKVGSGKWLVKMRVEADEKGPHIRGVDHPSLKLEAPDGSVYSFGLHRPGFSFMHQGAILHMVEPGEFYSSRHGTIKETAFEVTEEKWANVLKTLLKDRKKDNVSYELMQGNCTKYVCDVLRESKVVDLSASLHNVRYIAHHVAHNMPVMPQWFLHRFARGFSSLVEKFYIISKIVGVAINIGVYIRSDVTKVNKDWFTSRGLSVKEAFFTKLGDVFEYNKIFLNSPWRLRQYQNSIDECRRSQSNQPYVVPSEIKVKVSEDAL